MSPKYVCSLREPSTQKGWNTLLYKNIAKHLNEHMLKTWNISRMIAIQKSVENRIDKQLTWCCQVVRQVQECPVVELTVCIQLKVVCQICWILSDTLSHKMKDTIKNDVKWYQKNCKLEVLLLWKRLYLRLAIDFLFFFKLPT